LLIFLQCVVTYVVLFSVVALYADILLGSVATHFWRGGIFNQSITMNFLLIPTVQEF